MTIRIITPWGTICEPGHYGPRCIICDAPIMFDMLRKRNCKCDKCNKFIIHSCKESYELKYNPNEENSISHDLWFDGKEWWGELDHQDGAVYLKQHFKVNFCPFCGIDLKTIVHDKNL